MLSFALSHLAGVTALATLFYATGWLLEALGRPVRVPALGCFLMRTGTGTVAWIYLLFVLACVGAFRPQVVLLLAASMLLLALLRAALAMRVEARTLGALGWLRARVPSRAELGSVAATASLPALVLLVIFVHALSPSIGWDDDVYHLTLPKLYLEHGGFRRVAFNVYSHWPHNVEMLYGLAMMVDDYVLAKLVHSLYLALVALAVYRSCRTRCARAIACAATLLFLGNDVVLFEATVANIDVAFALYFLMAVACADEYLRGGETATLIRSGMFCGALAGTKLSGLAGVACVAVFLALSRPAWLLRPRRLGLSALALGLPTLLLGAPWYVKSYLYTGNPLYPMFFAQLGGIEWSTQLSEQFFGWQQGMGMGRSPRDYLLLPVRIVLEADYSYERFDGHISTFWLAAVPLAIVVAWRSGRGRSELICAGLYFVFWAVSSQQMRFLIAALPLLAIAAGHAADVVCAWPRSRVVQAGLRLMVLLGSCAAVVSAAQAKSLGSAWADSRRLFEHGPSGAPVSEGYVYVNEHTPKDAKVLLLNTNFGFFLDRDYIADSFPEASQLSWLLARFSSKAELLALLRRLGVTHLYLVPKRGGIAIPPALEQLLQDEQHVNRLYQCKRKRCVIYQLR